MIIESSIHPPVILNLLNSLQKELKYSKQVNLKCNPLINHAICRKLDKNRIINKKVIAI